MTKVNYHLHTTISDGKLTPEQVILECIKEKIDHICLTDHYPVPDNLDPYQAKFYSEEGFKELLSLKQKYKDKIDISIGAEFEWLGKYEKWYKQEVSKREYDFTIGSVHSFLAENGQLYGFWDKKEEIEEFIQKVGGKKEYVKEYFNQLRLMTKSRIFDTVGHFDIVKLNNQNNELFSEEEGWYKEEVLKTLEAIKESGMCIEINTRGILKQGEGRQYPSLWILKEANLRKIPITIGTDLHRSGELEPFLEKASQLAKQAGYSSVKIFKKRIPIEIKL